MKIIVQFFFLVGGGWGGGYDRMLVFFVPFRHSITSYIKIQGEGGGAKSKETIIQVPKTVNPNMVQNIRVKSQTNK